jgi:chondroitin AC lyase
MLHEKICAMSLLLFLLCPSHNNSRRNDTQFVNRSSDVTHRLSSNPDLEVVRKRVIDDLLQPALDESLIKSLMQSIKPDGSWPDIDYVDVSRTGFQHSRHLENMFELSRAYKMPDSPWYQNPVVKNLAMSSLDFWLEHDFMCDNWWWNEMGTPRGMINTLLVLDADLNENQIRQGLRIAGRANLEASGARPGGDLIQIAGMLGKQALFSRDETVLERVVNVMADEIKVTTGRGLKPDMSFHHRVDNVICTLSYGLGYANAFSYWAVTIAGTKYRFPDHATRLLIDYFLDGICKSMVYGRFPDPGAKNRDLSRKGTLRPAGAELARNLLKTSDYRKAELEQIVAIREAQLQPDLTWNRFFWHSEYGTHQRPDYFASVRMHSSRNYTMEQPHNEEGLKMHHVGDGSNFISVTGEEYFDIFPVWDWQKIPGTTVVQKPVHPHWKQIAKKGLTDLVGGVSDGKYGTIAMDFRSAHDPLKAHKAWFFFDDEYVCLGAGISAEAEYPVVTTLNQCLLNSEVIIRSRKEESTLPKGTRSVPNVSWVFHDRVGYVFTEPQTINISNTMATGNWREINHQASASNETVEKEVFTLWIDHGVKPQEATYEYIVVPASTKPDLDRYTKNSPIEILENSPSLQAVMHKELSRTEIAFYQAGKVKLNDNIILSGDSPCLVMVKTNGKGIEGIAVSDPTHKLTSVRLRTSVLIEGSGEGWRATWNKKGKESTLDIQLPQQGYAGESVVIDFPLPQ